MQSFPPPDPLRLSDAHCQMLADNPAQLARMDPGTQREVDEFLDRARQSAARQADAAPMIDSREGTGPAEVGRMVEVWGAYHDRTAPALTRPMVIAIIATGLLLGGLLALLQRPDAPRPAQDIRPTAFERSI